MLLVLYIIVLYVCCRCIILYTRCINQVDALVADCYNYVVSRTRNYIIKTISQHRLSTLASTIDSIPSTLLYVAG